MTDAPAKSAAADVSMTLNDNGISVWARLRGTDVETVVDLGQFILDSMSAGRKTLVRAEPSAEEERDYESGEVHVTGRVRFTVLDEEGEAEKVAPEQSEVLAFAPSVAFR